jgi:hypothetical protein
MVRVILTSMLCWATVTYFSSLKCVALAAAVEPEEESSSSLSSSLDPMEVIGAEDDDDNNTPGEDIDFDDRTFLDIFAEKAKEYLTQNAIPDTDFECQWDWKYVRCEPYCSCSYKPMLGDYHLGRSCRRQEKENCDPVQSRPNANQLQILIQRLLSVTERSIHTVASKTKEKYGHLQEHVCKDLPEINCENEEEGSPVLAWQEKLFCREMLPHCAFEYSWPKLPHSLLETKLLGAQKTDGEG